MNLGSVLEEGGLDELVSKYSLWTRRIRCWEKGGIDRLFETLKGASEEWLRERMDLIVSMGIVKHQI